MQYVVDIALLTAMGATALAVLRLRSLFAIVMLSGLYSLLAASMFVVLDAVDVAFTEAAVGAGISTVLMLGVLTLVDEREKPGIRVSLLPLIVVVITGAALIQATLDFPTFADPQAPANLHVAPRYLEESGREIGIPNVVTSVLASYRGYDTLGETTVIFTAGIAVLMLMGRARGERPPPRNGGGTGGNEGAPRRRED